jgi:hypothetical protein
MADLEQRDGQEPDPRIAELTACIAQYDRETEKWMKRVDKIERKYRAGDGGAQNDRSGDCPKFNILWSNVQTLVPATFSRLPQPDVSRRFRDNDPVGRVAALLLERAEAYEVEQYPDFAATMRQCVYDRFLGGRGTAWARYEPHFKAASEQLPEDGTQVTEDVDEPNEELDYECSPVDYVHPKEFGHGVARTWEEVPIVWRIVYMFEDAVKTRFGEEIAAKLPYDASPQQKDKARGGDGTPKQAKIYEMWDKRTKKALWFSKSLGQIIDERDDPLGLTDFFPCPRPLYATLTNNTLVPVPDYKLYEEQALLLDTLMDRIDGLVKALQVKGVYDAAVPELARMFTEAVNTDLVPVKNWAAFAEKNGLAGALDIVDLQPFYEALRACYEAVVQIKEIIYEITGISDIVRGQTDSSETLGAQQIKQNFVGLRLKNMQRDVACFAAELLKLKGQIICAKYSPQTIIKISAAEQLSEADRQYIEPALELLIGPERMQDPEADPGPNPLRCFRIDVEADSLVQMDEEGEKTARMEFLKATGTFLKEALPVVQANPLAAPLIVQMLKFGVTAFKVGKTIEGDFDQALDQLKQAAAQPQPPKQDPEMAKVQADQATAQAKIQADAAAENARVQADAMIERNRLMMEQQFEQQRMAMEERSRMREAEIDARLALMDARLKAETAIEVAEIGAKATLSAQQESAAESATKE